jgi:hypothetical protein
MTMVAAPIAPFPARPTWLQNAAPVNATFDSASDALIAVFQILKSGTIDNVHYRINGVTSPVATHRIELRTVDATTGLPSAAGTLYGGSTSITVNAATYAAGTNYTAAINATVTAGDLVALVFDLSAYTSGSFTQLDRMGPYLGDAISSNRVSSLPYGIRNTTGSNVLNSVMPGGFALEYSGGVFQPVTPLYVNFVGTASSVTVANTGTTRRGNKFRPPTKRRAIGIYGTFDLDGNVTLTLRDSGGTLLATATPDKDVRGSTAISDGFWMFDSGTTVTLTAGSDYYVGMEGQDATGGIIYYATGVSNAMLGCMPGGTTTYGFTYAGSYSDANTTLYAIGLLTDQEDDGASAGGGGLLTHPGMTGGMRG